MTLGFDSFQKCPQGGWQKASDTTIILEIFEAFCDGHTAKSAQEPILAWTHTAVANLNACLRLLYRCGLWMTQQQAAEAACCGLNFLKSYGHLVHLTILANRDRFPLTPKMHYIHHLMVDMQTQSASAAWSLNCVASTVQMDEDFVGWNARASRRVGAQHMSLRCLQRYLLQAAERITPEYLRWKPDASERARACLAKRWVHGDSELSKPSTTNKQVHCRIPFHSKPNSSFDYHPVIKISGLIPGILFRTFRFINPDF